MNTRNYTDRRLSLHRKRTLRRGAPSLKSQIDRDTCGFIIIFPCAREARSNGARMQRRKNDSAHNDPAPDCPRWDDSQSPRSRFWSDYLSLSKSLETRMNLVSRSTAPCHSRVHAETLISLRLVAILGLHSLCFDTLRKARRFINISPRRTKSPFSKWIAITLSGTNFASDCDVHFFLAKFQGKETNNFSCIMCKTYCNYCILYLKKWSVLNTCYF